MVYIGCLKTHIPQRLINHFCEKYYESAVKVGHISGLFPFVFNINEVNIGTSIKIYRIVAKLSLKTLKVEMCVRDVYIENIEPISDDTTNQNQTTRTKSFVNHAYAVCLAQMRKLSILKYMQSISVNNLQYGTKAYSVKFNKKNLVVKELTSNSTLCLNNIKTTFESNLCCCECNCSLVSPSLEITGDIKIDQQNLITKWNIAKCSFDFLNRSSGSINMKHEKLGDFIGFLSSTASHSTSKIPTDFAEGYVFIPYNTEVICGKVKINDSIEIDVSKGSFKETTVNNINVNNVHIANCVITNDCDGLAFTCSGIFTFNGTFKRNCLNVQNIKSKLHNKQLSINNLYIDLFKKYVDKTVINIDSCKIETSKFSFETKENCKWRIPTIHLYNKDNSLYFGDANIDGAIDNKCCFVNFSLKQGQIKNSRAKTLNISTSGSITFSKNQIFMNSLRIDSGNGNCLEVSLKMIAKNLSELISGISKILDKEPIIDNSIILEGKMAGTFSLRPIGIFLNTGDIISGVVSSQLTFAGTLSNPVITGTFALKNGFYENFNNGVVLKNITLQANGVGSELKITHIHLDDGTTSPALKQTTSRCTNSQQRCANGRGAFALFSCMHTFEPNLTIDLDCYFLQVTYGKVVKARVSGPLRMCGPITGKSKSPMVTGNITIDEMVVDVSSESSNVTIRPDEWTIKEKGVQILTNAVSDMSSKTASKLFELNITLTGHVVVLSNDLKCILVGTIVANGTIASPYLIGTLRIDPQKSSHYNLFGEIMVVRNGFICYDDVHVNNPYIKVVLATEINHTEIVAILAGHISNTTITLQSKPHLSSEAILSLLLFRHGINELSVQQNLQIRAFSSQMLQGNPLSFIDKLRNKFKLDSLEIVETQNVSSGELVQSIRVGKSIKGARVFFNKDISTKNNTKVTVRYDITQEVGVEANFSTEKDDSGVGIQWMKRY
ncbi:MAG: translocation/assembly module TamB domain-containing protein [Holosporales bacterium]|jgi:autotransporter translocation and assembly factor TamB|nr:translocation/assembly module TamB domain-containing protein [Holosporales bacterium]